MVSHRTVQSKRCQATSYNDSRRPKSNIAALRLPAPGIATSLVALGGACSLAVASVIVGELHHGQFGWNAERLARGGLLPSQIDVADGAVVPVNPEQVEEVRRTLPNPRNSAILVAHPSAVDEWEQDRMVPFYLEIINRNGAPPAVRQHMVGTLMQRQDRVRIDDETFAHLMRGIKQLTGEYFADADQFGAWWDSVQFDDEWQPFPIYIWAGD